MALRAEAGRYLRSLREAAGLTQAQCASAMGLAHYTYMSQIEGGLTKFPPARVSAFAKAVGVSEREIAMNLLRCYNPDIYRSIFGE